MKNVRKIKWLIVAMVLLASSSIYAQEQTENKEEETFKHSVGLGAGISTGYGFSYRYFPKRIGVQANFIPIKDTTRLIVSAGVTFLFRLGKIDEFTFYAYQANHYFYKEQTSYEIDYSYQSVPPYNYIETTTETLEEGEYFNNGMGIGGEYVHRERFGFNLMAGYSQQENFKRLDFTIEAAIYFKF